MWIIVYRKNGVPHCGYKVFARKADAIAEATRYVDDSGRVTAIQIIYLKQLKG